MVDKVLLLWKISNFRFAEIVHKVSNPCSDLSPALRLKNLSGHVTGSSEKLALDRWEREG